MSRLLAHTSPGIHSPCDSASSSCWLPAGNVAFPPAAACNMSPGRPIMSTVPWMLEAIGSPNGNGQWYESATGTRKDITNSSGKSMPVHSFLLIIYSP